MKQVLQSYRTGELVVEDVPTPPVQHNRLLIRNINSFVSAGTERQMINLARKSLVGKALARPDLVQKVIAVAQTEGVMEAYQQATSRLDSPVPLGYSSAGQVIAVGDGVQSCKVGNRVACAGSGYASHAEIVSVPRTLCVPIPDGVDYESAAFVALGGITLHAVRMGEAALGETVAVIGLGLLGLLAVQMLRAAGCYVLGMDPNPARCQLAEQLGCDLAADSGQHMADAVREFTAGHGADAVIIFAATSSNQPIELAAEIARERGRVIVPGLVGLDIPRKIFYEKELSLRISRAWGPGLYDPDYESGKQDYPYPFVRWTAQRNMAAFLDLVAQGRVLVDKLVTHRFPIECATEAYQLITEGKEAYIGVLLTYDSEADLSRTVVLEEKAQRSQRRQKRQMPSDPAGSSVPSGPLGVGLAGAGNFAKATLLPAISRVKGVHLRGVATATGASARHTGDKFGFDYCTTDYHELLNDPAIDAIIIATRHNTHAHFTAEALRTGKHVFVEKPLALNLEQLREVAEAYGTANGISHMATRSHQPSAISHQLMVGFNRRFSPFTVALKEWLALTDLPMVVNVRVNAGFVPLDRWEQDPEVGGGRIVGEVCHFVDLIQYLTDAYPVQVHAQAIKAAGQYLSEDNLVITLKMSDGSVGTITYTASGDKAFPRERVEVFRGGAVGLIENFKAASFTYQGRIHRKRNLFSVDRGHRAEMEAFFSALSNGDPPSVDFTEYLYTTLTTFAIEESLRQGAPVVVDPGVLQELERPRGLDKTSGSSGSCAPSGPS